ncbi:hypothetical protein VTK73DRAFT_1486 [Phialemonium thermophilum]|uniref:Uncharacterized protein n=1 Tax=Phialemonium thermophilum TaxID=223376 RepID=A0ABR3VTC7_9PEZI
MAENKKVRTPAIQRFPLPKNIVHLHLHRRRSLVHGRPRRTHRRCCRLLPSSSRVGSVLLVCDEHPQPRESLEQAARKVLAHVVAADDVGRVDACALQPVVAVVVPHAVPGRREVEPTKRVVGSSRGRRGGGRLALVLQTANRELAGHHRRSVHACSSSSSSSSSRRGGWARGRGDVAELLATLLELDT